MAHPVIHFEIMSTEAPKLREFYSSLFDWKFSPPQPSTGEGAGDYTTIEPQGEHGIGGGIGTATNGYPGHVTFYVYSDNLEDTLKKAESLGGKRVLNPSTVPNMPIEIALFDDPAGNTIGLVNPHEM